MCCQKHLCQLACLICVLFLPGETLCALEFPTILDMLFSTSAVACNPVCSLTCGLMMQNICASWLAQQHEQCRLCRAVFDLDQGLRCGLENICVQAGLLSHASASVAHAARCAHTHTYTPTGLACLYHQSTLLCCSRTVLQCSVHMCELPQSVLLT